jgi:hypothetical protein
MNKVDWTDWLMDALWIALITVGGGLLGIVVTRIFENWSGYKKIKAAIGNTEKKSLSVQHEDMENSFSHQHKDMENKINDNVKNSALAISNGINSYMDITMPKIDSNNDAISSVKEILIAQQRDEENRYNNLTDKQRDIKSHVDDIYLMARDWERLNTENKELREHLEKVKEHDLILTEQIRQMTDTINHLSEKLNENNGLDYGDEIHRGRSR